MKFRRKIKQKPRVRSEGGILFMFFQDYENQIIPHDFDRNLDFSVCLHGEVDKEREVVEFLSNICDERHYRRGSNLKGVVCGAVETISNELIRNGVARYRLSDDGKMMLPNHYDISVVKYLGHYFSKSSYGGRFSREGFEYIGISKKNVCSFKLPREICSPLRHKKILAFLRKQKLGIPEYFNLQDNKYRFDVREFSNLGAIATLKISKPWGWDGRKSFGNDLSEYYRLVLSIRKARSLALLRDHILSEIGAFLMQKGIQVRIRIYGVLYSEDFEGILEDLETGKIDMKQAYERSFSGYKNIF